jgi:hypothetical protein
LALSASDGKRYILDDGVNTLAWGHYKINKEKDRFLKAQKDDVSNVLQYNG